MTDPAEAAAAAHRLYWGRVLSASLRMARDVDVAEEATADAFLLALQTWPERGVPGGELGAHRAPVDRSGAALGPEAGNRFGHGGILTR